MATVQCFAAPYGSMMTKSLSLSLSLSLSHTHTKMGPSHMYRHIHTNFNPEDILLHH
jgi:hypothetical protein